MIIRILFVLALLFHCACNRADLPRENTARQLSVKQSASTHPARLGEKNLRSIIVSKVMPGYPAESIKNKSQGVVVAQTDFDLKGRVAQVRVLESPDKYIERSVKDALKQWKISSVLLNNAPVRVQGKLTFYFKYENNKGKVFMP